MHICRPKHPAMEYFSCKTSHQELWLLLSRACIRPSRSCTIFVLIWRVLGSASYVQLSLGYRSFGLKAFYPNQSYGYQCHIKSHDQDVSNLNVHVHQP